MRSAEQWEKELRGHDGTIPLTMTQKDMIADISALEKFAIGGNGTTHWYYKDAYASREAECELQKKMLSASNVLALQQKLAAAETRIKELEAKLNVGA